MLFYFPLLACGGQRAGMASMEQLLKGCVLAATHCFLIGVCPGGPGLGSEGLDTGLRSTIF